MSIIIFIITKYVDKLNTNGYPSWVLFSFIVIVLLFITILMITFVRRCFYIYDGIVGFLTISPVERLKIKNSFLSVSHTDPFKILI